VHLTSPEDPRLLSFLHMGVGGIVVQQVRTRAQVEQLVERTRFPPLGHRGAHSGVRSDDYGRQDYDAFMETANRTLVVGIAIEDIAGIEAADELFSVPGLTIGFVGMHDLSHALGVPNQLGHPRVLEAVRGVAEIAARHGVAFGLPGYAHSAAELADLGAKLVISPGNEYSFFLNALTEFVQTSRAQVEGRG
jgi:2-keto-3-deoxy-L-rhamnonate aldolase RhmA